MTLQHVCLSSDARFCEELGTPLGAYKEYRVRHARPALSVSWLPPSVDLAAMVMQVRGTGVLTCPST